MRFIKRIYHYFVAWFYYGFYGRPGRKLIVVGVTGTKGKSTTCRLIASVLEAGGFKVATLSTIEIKIGDKVIPDKPQMTMLGRGLIQKYLCQAIQAGCKYAVIETSSEGILQHRHVGLLYDVVVFTNLGTEHQERHGGFENLKKAKGELFKSLTKYPRKTIDGKTIPKISIVNADDPNADFFAGFPADQKWKFGTKFAMQHSSFDIKAQNVNSDETGSAFLAGESQFKLNILGAFNIPNALAAIAAGRSQGISDKEIALGLESVKVIPGRMEFVDLGQPFAFVVDYAHEPMSLTALFTALRPIVKAPGRLVGLIGSDGGGRDIGKRQRMGKIAGELCDIIIVTDVNPWDEDPQEIAEMLAKGAREAGKIDGRDLFITINRREAIKQACQLAGRGGAAAITAKGTEQAIIGKGGSRLPWDDKRVASEVISSFSRA